LWRDEGREEKKGLKRKQVDVVIKRNSFCVRVWVGVSIEGPVCVIYIL